MSALKALFYARWPGSLQDSRVLRNSSVNKEINRVPANAVLIRNIGYGTAPWLRPTYYNAVPYEVKAYKKLHLVINLFIIIT